MIRWAFDIGSVASIYTTLAQLENIGGWEQCLAHVAHVTEESNQPLDLDWLTKWLGGNEAKNCPYTVTMFFSIHGIDVTVGPAGVMSLVEIDSIADQCGRDLVSVEITKEAWLNAA